jgi:hypothetical protein
VCGISEQKNPTLVPAALRRQLVDGIDLPAVTFGDDGLEAFDAAVGVCFYDFSSHCFLVFSGQVPAIPVNRFVFRHLPHMGEEDVLTSRLVVGRDQRAAGGAERCGVAQSWLAVGECDRGGSWVFGLVRCSRGPSHGNATARVLFLPRGFHVQSARG